MLSLFHGYKYTMKYLILMASLCCASAFAQSVNTDVLVSDDSDNQKATTATVNVVQQTRDNVTSVITYINTSISDPTDSAHADTLKIATTVDLDKVKVSAGLGVYQAANTKLLPELRIETRLSKTVTVGLYGDISGVDSINGINKNITKTSAGAYAEYNADTYGVYGKYSYERYSDDNIRKYLDFKSYLTMFPEQGVSAYIRIKHHTNTISYTGDYFSPDRYTRSLVGLSIRRTITPDTVFTGHIDSGYQWVDGERFPSWSAKIGIENKITSALTWRAVYGVDQFQPDYKYRYLMLYLNYYF